MGLLSVGNPGGSVDKYDPPKIVCMGQYYGCMALYGWRVTDRYFTNITIANKIANNNGNNTNFEWGAKVGREGGERINRAFLSLFLFFFFPLFLCYFPFWLYVGR